jgi:hypothetical protein
MRPLRKTRRGVMPFHLAYEVSCRARTGSVLRATASWAAALDTPHALQAERWFPRVARLALQERREQPRQTKLSTEKY